MPLIAVSMWVRQLIESRKECSMPAVRKAIGVAALAAAALVVMPVQAGIGKPPPAPKPAALMPQAQTEALLPPKTKAEAEQRSHAPRPLSVGVPADQKNIADRHMAGDEALRAMLQGRAYKVVKEGAWVRPVSQQRIGVVREIALTAAVDMPMRRWPVVYWKDGADTYQRFAYNASWAGVTGATVFVDDNLGVVGLTPDAGAVLTQGPGNDWIATLPKGAPR
jgi:hypothetical protein